MASKQQEGNDRDHGHGQTDEARGDARMLDSRTAGADCAVTTESFGTEANRDPKQEEVTHGEQTTQAKKRDCNQFALARWGPCHTTILGLSAMTLKQRGSAVTRKRRLTSAP